MQKNYSPITKTTCVLGHSSMRISPWECEIREEWKACLRKSNYIRFSLENNITTLSDSQSPPEHYNAIKYTSQCTFRSLNVWLWLADLARNINYVPMRQNPKLNKKSEAWSSTFPHRWLAGARVPSAMSEGPRRTLGAWQQEQPIPRPAAVKGIFHSLSGATKVSFIIDIRCNQGRLAHFL